MTPVTSKEEARKLLQKFYEKLRFDSQPSMDIFTQDFVTKSINAFLFEEEAREKLDAEAVAEGFLNLADKLKKESIQIEALRAAKVAEENAKAELRQLQENERLAVIVAEEKAAKEKRDIEDAEFAARKKALAAAGLTNANADLIAAYEIDQKAQSEGRGLSPEEETALDALNSDDAATDW